MVAPEVALDQLFIAELCTYLVPHLTLQQCGRGKLGRKLSDSTHSVTTPQLLKFCFNLFHIGKPLFGKKRFLRVSVGRRKYPPCIF